MIKWDYNINDLLNFILTVIKWDYGMNDRSKLALMIEEGDEDAQTIKGTPKGP